MDIKLKEHNLVEIETFSNLMIFFFKWSDVGGSVPC